MHRHVLSFAQCLALAIHSGTRGKKTPNICFYVHPPAGFTCRGTSSASALPRSAPALDALPRDGTSCLAAGGVGMEPSASMSQQDPLNTSPAGSTPPDRMGSFWQAPSACYNLSSLKGRILSSLLMFYAAWLHLQRKTHIAVNDYTSAVLQAE